MARRGSATRGSSAQSSLMLEFKSLQEEPVEGFRVKLLDDDNLFEWEVALFGPPQTLYEGGYFKALMKFPPDYPYSPPSVKFVTKVWHPNVYENGDLCISILHPPIDDPQSGELPCERWNPTQNVRTVMLSVISLLNEPNTYSPANVDASVMYRKWKESNGKDKEYENIIRKQVAATRQEAERDNVIVPTTLEEYCIKHQSDKVFDIDELTDFYDDDYGDDDLEDYDEGGPPTPSMPTPPNGESLSPSNSYADLASCENFDLSSYESLLTTKKLGRPCISINEVSSTIDVANTIGANAMVVARTQSNGRGQRDHVWDSQPGCAMVSLKMEISSSSFAGQRISFLQHCLAMAIAQTLEALDSNIFGPQNIRIKWPNDILFINGANAPQKIGGVLVNMTPSGDTYPVIVSFGLNVFNSKPTTCVADILSSSYGKKQPSLTLHGVIASIINQLEETVSKMNENDFEALKSSYMSRSLHRNQEFDHSREGRVRVTGIDDYGYLQAVRLSDGRNCKLLSLE